MKLKEKTSKVIIKATDVSPKVGTSIGKTSKVVKEKASTTINTTKNSLTKTMDQNGDGQVTIEDVIIMGLKIPGIKINRTEFLKREFSKNYSKEVVDNIIKYNPAHVPSLR